MDIIGTILELGTSIANASSESIWLKIIFMGLLGVFSVAYYFYRDKIRRDVADANQDRDRADDVEDNRRTETQNAQDGQSVRDRLRGPNE